VFGQRSLLHLLLQHATAPAAAAAAA
jgi:hypothetical protein